MTFDNNLIHSLNFFSLNEMFIEKFLQKNVEIQNKEIKNDKNDKNDKDQIIKIKPREKFFIPKEKDKLFWCFFIMKNDFIQYEMIENKNFVLEKKIKI